MSDSNLLELRLIRKSFGPVRVLEDISLDLKSGEVLCLLGENGAGKSTLMKIMAGALQPTGGEMWLGQKPLSLQGPGDALDQGIILIHQETNLIRNLSVAENIFLGRPLLTPRGNIDLNAMFERSRVYLDELGAKDVDTAAKVYTLTSAQQQKVEIARALAFSAKIIIFDEPTAALAGEDADQLFLLIRSLSEQGVAIIYISHRLEELNSVGTRVAVLRDGVLIKQWPTTDVPRPELIEAMVDRKIGEAPPCANAPSDEVCLQVTDLTRDKEFVNISFDVKTAEVFGFAGLVGSGRSEVAHCIFGRTAKDRGEIVFQGQPLEVKSPRHAISRGIALIPEERKQQGLFLHRNVSENFASASMGHFLKNGFLSNAAIQRRVSDYIDRLKIKCTPQQPIRELSGGNQQKVLLAKWLETKPKFLILDEPTRGIDVGAKELVYDLIKSLAEEGMTILVISSELPELLAITHRIAVFREGRISGILKNDGITQKDVMHLAVSH